MTTAPPLLAVDALAKRYALPRERLSAPRAVVHALRGVSFTMASGGNLGIVGESGSGKSTLARLVMALELPTTGRVTVLGQDLHALRPPELRAARRNFQMVFQDPNGSLDPRMKVGRIVAEPLGDDVDARAGASRVGDVLEAVGLQAADAAKHPHEFSGGQRQRIAIARAIVTRPRLVVADEPVSALDVSVQAQVLNLLLDLRQQFGVTYLFISHDLAVVEHMCDEVAVMFAGRIVEQGAVDVLFRHAAHPYTRALIAAVPGRGGGFAASHASPKTLPALVSPSAASPSAPSLSSSPSPNRGKALPLSAAAPHSRGCAYGSRCAYRQPRCETDDPTLRVLDGTHRAACHFAETVMSGPSPLTRDL